MIGFRKLILNTEDSGKSIGEKLFFVLSPKQKEELIQFIIEVEGKSGKGEERFPDMVLYSNLLGLNKLQLQRPFTEIEIGELYLCLEQRRVCVRNIEIHLTMKEFDFIVLLMMNPKRVFTYELLVDLIWHEDYAFYSRKAVNNHVSNLRKKLKIAPDIPDYVKSVYGVGYKFEV